MSQPNDQTPPQPGTQPATQPAVEQSADTQEQVLNFNRDVVDRRLGGDRRKQNGPSPDYDGPDRRSADGRNDRRCGLERRRGAGIRRIEERRSAEEGEMTPDQFEFIRAVEAYKRVNHKLFPTWTEVLEVVLQLGYRKCELRDIDLPNVPEPDLWQPTAAARPAAKADRRDKAA